MGLLEGFQRTAYIGQYKNRTGGAEIANKKEGAESSAPSNI